MRFSERYGYKQPLQLKNEKDISASYRNELWSTLYGLIFSLYRQFPLSEVSTTDTALKDFFIDTYTNLIHKPIDKIPENINLAIKKIKKYFMSCKWYEVYEMIEILVKNFPNIRTTKNLFTFSINDIFEKNSAKFRLINNQIIRITSEQEIQSIEEALANTNPYSGVQQHLNQALKLMSDRQNPDYRNSIKEAISAVESICKIVTNDEKATLGKALKIVEDKFGLHPALKGSLSQLYGYTSDGDGIRHAMLEESNLSYIDAKFMLVACTNFINYLIEKTK
ncbi:AbiJ-NTD4 domain-containing protein [Acinetobacter sp. CFCC 10889]|uniref:AbiJ-NTD4 domain-containing protein n=1 Tax=Acinetobacter sp. CFCC 10889 TaxID=1775557 RepID=UPI000DD0BB2F|nr:hypothetical protein [Acinetobacter sp. CFCC 10889]